jgi:hypothetical protein
MYLFFSGTVEYTRKMGSYTILVETLEGKRPLGRPRSRLQDNIKMDLIEIEQTDMDWIHLAQDMNQWLALVKRVIKIRVQSNFGKFLSS